MADSQHFFRAYRRQYVAATVRHGCTPPMIDQSCVPCLRETLSAGAVLHALRLDARYADSPRAHEARQTWSATGQGDRDQSARSSAIHDALCHQALALEHLPLDGVLASRALIEQLHLVAADAKDGVVIPVLRALEKARCGALQLGVRELELVIDIERLPIEALACFTQNDLPRASRLLGAALATATELADRYSHGYLTVKRLHLAINLARVKNASGRPLDAERLLDAISDVLDGDVPAWPFHGGSTLRVPVESDQHQRLVSQVERERCRLAHQPTANTPRGAS